MAWQTFLRSVQPPLAPTDSFEITIEYVDTLNAARNFTRGLHIHAGQFASKADLEALLAAQRATLTQLDTIRTVLAGLVDTEL